MDRIDSVLKKLREGTCSQDELIELDRLLSKEEGSVFSDYLDSELPLPCVASGS